MITVTKGKGFHLTFDNGWTASVQFGEGSYTDHRYDKPPLYPTCKIRDVPVRWLSVDAEVAAWPKDSALVELPEANGDTVRGYLSANKVLEFLNWVANKRKKE